MSAMTQKLAAQVAARKSQCRICFPVLGHGSGKLSPKSAANFLEGWYDETTREWCNRLCDEHSTEVAAELLKLESKSHSDKLVERWNR